MEQRHLMRSRVTVPARGRELVRYAAAFIHPEIASVRIEDGVFLIECCEAIDSSLVDSGLERLIDRFSSVELPEAEPLFTLGAPDPFPDLSIGVPEDAVQEIAAGLVVLRAPYSDLLRFLDWAVLMRFAVPFAAREETYPNVMPIETLARTQHFTSFPEHVHFVTHLIEDLDVLEGFATRAGAGADTIRPKPQELALSRLVHNPATCYHCYASRKGQSLARDTAITAISRCHRFESSNHAERGRLLEFSLREVIFLGAPDFARDTREQVLEQVRNLAQDWQLYGSLIPANDPFFTGDFEPKAMQQRRLAMKFEYKAALPDGSSLAVMSSNLHGPTFGKAFAISLNGRPANTACLGFGLERLAIALVAQHGAEPSAWPTGLKQDFERWRASDPLCG